ncbi:MAG: HD domain-containing protein [Candidatus Lokiarchaeota archaeon]|nr:HD domain-containing protein [Candidatus Lokiarchaeota archaeon]
MWRDELIKFAAAFKHPAWGFSHFKRVNNLTLDLAKSQQIKIDEDAIFAAAYLHDIGAFHPYKKKGRNHSEVAMEQCDDILQRIGFPSEKIFKVKDIIRTHMFNINPSENVESILFHDADTLDFMGTIGITRLLAIVGKEDWTPDLKSAIKLIQKFYDDLPSKIITTEAKKICEKRKSEMEYFLKDLSQQTDNFNLL